MAVDSGFLTKVKLSLRKTDTTFDSQIEDLIEEAILDLTSTANIKEFSTATADAFQTGAVTCYVQYKWFSDEKFLVMYNDHKSKMAVSSVYSDYEE